MSEPKWFREAEKRLDEGDRIEKTYEGHLDGRYGYLFQKLLRYVEGGCSGRGVEGSSGGGSALKMLTGYRRISVFRRLRSSAY